MTRRKRIFIAVAYLATAATDAWTALGTAPLAVMFTSIILTIIFIWQAIIAFRRRS